LASGHAASAGHAEPESEAGQHANSHGIDLGEYRIRSYYPVQAQKSIVRFTLYATAQDEQLVAMRHLAEERKHKIRDQVITVARLVPLVHFDEPDLKSFRRRILLRLRRALPELAIASVYVSDFQIRVQSL
jgi:hypothetical protein